MTFEIMIKKLNFIEQIEAELSQKMDKNIQIWTELAKTAYQGENFDFELCHQSPYIRLSVVVVLLVEKYERYRLMKIPDSVIFNTFRDVSLRARLYYEKTGQVGIETDDVIWFRHIMNVEIFQIGSLQFQPFAMLYLEEKDMEYLYMIYSFHAREFLPAGCPVLNCHIPYGADLRNEKVEESLRLARNFFEYFFPTVHYKAFLCYSWILFPSMVKRLSDHSRIRQFSDRFCIIGTCMNPEQAMENLFTKKRKNSGRTFLQNMALDHKELFGYACGVILF